MRRCHVRIQEGTQMNKQILLGTVSAMALLLAAPGAVQAQSNSTTTTTGNVASGVTVDTSNEIEAFAFKHFTGALQVQQKGSVNSSVSQNMAIDAFKLRGIGVGFFAAATSTNTVSGNTATNASIPSVDSEGTDNSIEDQAFKHAKGAVQVQQNRSINSSTGQNMDIDPISNPGGGAGQVSATASLTSNVNGNSAAGSSVSGSNTIDGGAFKHAGGAFQVQQSNSANSAAGQNMAVGAFDARHGFGDGSEGGGDNAVANSTVTGNAANTNFTSKTGDVVDTENEIGGGAFKHAGGAFQVQQNGSMNSAVGQNVAISAEKETGAKTEATLNARATTTNTDNQKVTNPFSYGYRL